MITNGVCTVYRGDENGGVFLVGVFPCMRQGVESYEVKKYGEENADKAAVYIPDVSAAIVKGDVIFFGEKSQPTDKEIYDALHVQSVTVNDFGSKNMQHLQLGVR